MISGECLTVIISMRVRVWDSGILLVALKESGQILSVTVRASFKGNFDSKAVTVMALMG